MSPLPTKRHKPNQAKVTSKNLDKNMVKLSFDDSNDERSSYESTSEEEAVLADNVTQCSRATIHEIPLFTGDHQTKEMH